MSQWGQPAGYQYPLQTGLNPQQQQQQQPAFQQQQPQFQQPSSFGVQGNIQPQATGFAGPRFVGQQGGFQQPQQGFQQQPQQPQQTGYGGLGGQGFIQSQPTGFPPPGGLGAGSGFAARSAPAPPVPPIPSQFQNQSLTPAPHQQQSNFLQPAQPPLNRFLSPSPGLGGPGLSAQPTGFAPTINLTSPALSAGGAARPLVPQQTGFMDPRLQMMSSTFLPANPASPYGAGGAPILPSQQLQGGLNLQQSFQHYNQDVKGTAAPKVPWALSRNEKKSYDQIFRAWDAGTGFISGATALEVFGQSGLSKEDLARIWTLADVDDRGKLNMAEFHIAMGLIYRHLNGNEIPDQLPPELVPPSARDLDGSVNFLKDVLKNESRSRSPASSSVSPSNRSGRDAGVYKHDDSEPPGGFYKPASRHIDRTAVRSRNEDDSPIADLSDMKRQLENTAKMLDRQTQAEANRTKEDEELEREMEDLKFRVKKVQEDLDYVSRGPRTSGKEEERRRLERELLRLMHERLPEVERRIKDREARKEREKREWDRERDRRNERFGRYDDRDEFDRERDRYDRDRDREREKERDRDRDYERRYDDRPRSPPRARSPPPPPPQAPPANAAPAPPPPPAPAASPAPNLKNMTLEERRAYARAEAQRRVEARKRELLGHTDPASPTVDTSVEDRLAQEKKEAEEKAREAERKEEERARARRERLEEERAIKEGARSATATPAPPTPAPAPPAPVVKAPAPPPPKPRVAPPPPKPRGSQVPAPAPPSAPRTNAVPPAVTRAVPAPSPAPPPPEPEDDEEERAFKARQDALRKAKEERAARLRELEREEAEARQAEEEYQARRQAFLSASKTPPPPAAVPAPAAPAPPPPAPPAPAVQEAPPPPPASEPAAQHKKSNPFAMMSSGGASPAVTSPPTAQTPGTSGSSTNPFFRPQTASTPTVPAPSKSPAPPAVKTSYHTAPGDSDDEDWGKEPMDEDDSSDDELTRHSRKEMANKIFGSILPRPQSTPAAATSPKAPMSPAPASAVEAGSVASPVPPPPVAPAPPPAPPVPSFAVAAPAPSSGSGDRSALMASIQGGLKLKKAVTVDKSGPGLSGRVLGDDAPPSHISNAPVVESPQPEPQFESIPQPPAMGNGDGVNSKSSYRQSVDWYAGLAADQGKSPTAEKLPSTVEEDEGEHEAVKESPSPAIPNISVTDVEPAAEHDMMDDIDKTKEHRVWTLYAYEGQAAQDLSFKENVILQANPSKTGGDWWHGRLLRDGKSGFFPASYVKVVKPVIATALYSYTGNNPDELPFAEGDQISIIEQTDDEWWKAEQGGVVFLAPAAYLQIAEEPAAKTDTPIESPGPKQDESKDRKPAPPPPSPIRSSKGKQNPWNLSSSDEEDEENVPEDKATERKTRQHERRMILEASGLIVKDEARPRPAKRRPAPSAPQRGSIASIKDLPSLPDSEPVDPATYLNDAYDRYENFKNSNNRFSVASFESHFQPPSPISPSTSSIANSLSPSQSHEGEGTRAYLRNLLGLSGMKSTSSEGSERPRLTISGPIPQGINSPQRELSPAFGSSWTSLVDKEALEGIPDDERKRQEAIFELIVTEGTYVRDVQLVVETFYSSMLPLLDSRSVSVIFANIEDILLSGTTFLSSLEERQKDCRLYIDRIGDILCQHMPNLHVYREYCVNQGNAIKYLQSLRDTNQELAKHLQKLRDEDPVVRNLDLSSYLLAPMQRITKYPLLIKQILHHTQPSPERDNIQKSLGIAEKILDNINETIREQEGQERLKEISKNLWIGQGRLQLNAKTNNMGPRRLLREGPLIKTKSGRKLQGFLCNDILVLVAEDGSLYRLPIPLESAQVKETRDDMAFQVRLNAQNDDTISLRATSVRDCQLWVEAVAKASRRCKRAGKGSIG